MKHKTIVDPTLAIKDWTVTETFRNQVTIERLNIILDGISATHATYGDVVGSAAYLQMQPTNESWFELLERITIVEAIGSGLERFRLRDPKSGQAKGFLARTLIFPETHMEAKGLYQFAKSNGVALDMTWERACQKAAFELLESHLVLNSWLGVTRPVDVPAPSAPSVTKLSRIYDVRWISFGQQNADCFASPVHACGVFLFPKDNQMHPLAFGLGAELRLEEALLKAEREAIQRLGSLWGKEIPRQVSELTPSPLCHQEYYLCPENHPVILDWLDGLFAKSAEALPPSETATLAFADLSMGQPRQFQVAKAYSNAVIPLIFGTWPERGFSRLDRRRQLHPIASGC